MRRLHAPRLPNRWRITLWIVGSVLAVTLAVGAFAVVQVKDRFTEQIDEELVNQSRGLAAALEIIEPAELERLAEQTPDGLGDTTYGLTVVGPDGEVLSLASGPPDDPDPPIDTSPRAISSLRGSAGTPIDLSSADGSTEYRAIVSQLDDGGLVVATRSLADREEAVRTVAGVLLLAGAVAAVLIVVTVTVVSGFVTRPLDAMIDTAEAIGEGDLTSRISTEGVEDVARLAAALNGMLDRLERAFADKAASEDALRRFVADASHELRTPLSAVLGYAELHQAGMAGSPEQVDRSMARIRAEGERMRLIVEELLTLARLDEGRPMEHLDVDLGELVRLAVADAGAIDPDRPLSLVLPPAGAPVVVSGDAMSLRQAVDNLLANTRAHTPVATPVEVRVTAADGLGVVEVSDEGPGLDPEVAAHVFDRFYRADRSRARSGGPGGSGLGLAIVAAIATTHGGTATVTSTPGSGSTFTLSIPDARPPTSKTARP